METSKKSGKIRTSVQKYWLRCFGSAVSGAKINTLVRTHRQCYFIWMLSVCACARVCNCVCCRNGWSDPEEPSLRTHTDTEESLRSASSVFSLRTPSVRGVAERRNRGQAPPGTRPKATRSLAHSLTHLPAERFPPHSTH